MAPVGRVAQARATTTTPSKRRQGLRIIARTHERYCSSPRDETTPLNVGYASSTPQPAAEWRVPERLRQVRQRDPREIAKKSSLSPAERRSRASTARVGIAQLSLAHLRRSLRRPTRGPQESTASRRLANGLPGARATDSVNRASTMMRVLRISEPVTSQGVPGTHASHTNPPPRQANATKAGQAIAGETANPAREPFEVNPSRSLMIDVMRGFVKPHRRRP